MRYENFEIEDFLQDEYFVKWVRHPTPETDYFWKLWLEKHPEKKSLIGLASEIVLNVKLKNNHHPSSGDILDVLENINKDKKSIRSTGRTVHIPSFKSIYRYAAVLLILCVFGILFRNEIFQFSGQFPESQATKVDTITKLTQRGQKLSIVLPDGTRVKLNAETKITFHEDKQSQMRIVYLEGEAFFDVAHNESKPFKIHTGRVETTVLGTSFNINAYPENDNIRVAVLSGKVKVESKNRGTLINRNILAPEEMYTFNKENQEISKSKVSVSEIIAWKDEIILFKDASYEEIQNTLERWYKVEFVVAQGLQVIEDFSGSYQSQSLERVLEGLNFTSNFRYDLRDNKVFVTNKKGD